MSSFLEGTWTRNSKPSIDLFTSVCAVADEESIELPVGLVSRARAFLYDVDDLFDIIFARALRKRVVSGSTFTKEVRLFFSKSNQLGFAVRTAHDVKDMKERLDDILNDLHRPSFKLNRIEESSFRRPDWKTHSFVHAEDVVGRDREREEIIKLLLPEYRPGEIAHQPNLSVISIIGFSGLGKTTLAQLVFNDERVRREFDLRLWACVNYFSNLREVLIEILAKVSDSFNPPDKSVTLERLVRDFIKTIGGRRYLLVLDDVRDEDASNWHELKCLLQSGNRGSMVLATVPNAVVARCLDSTEYQLSVLSEESAWSLLRKIVFWEVDLGDYPELVSIGKQIVHQTGYVPLAVVTVGRLLDDGEKTNRAWSRILDNIKDYITPQLKDMKERPDGIPKDMIQFNFMSNPFEKNPVRAPGRRETHSFVRAEDVIGRDQEKKEIIEWLLSESHQPSLVPVISITGFSGLGKTTLAQLVFNDDRVQREFELRLWACVNYLSTLREVMITILASVGCMSDLQEKNLEQLRHEFIKTIRGRKYLLVLDGVCDEDRYKWHELQLLFKHYGGRGSKVLATVPNIVVARCLDSTEYYQLNVLSEEIAWSLFEKKAFPEGGLCNYSELVPIGYRIVRQTGYVPLAIVAVGNILHHEKKEKKAWLSILDNLKVNINPQLKPSYNQLPPHLKRCFAYCSLFPKDCTFDKDELIRMWLAQCFLDCSDGSHVEEELGHGCFFDLVRRNFLDVEIYTRKNRLGHKVRMHEFLHALATEVAGGEFECLFEDLKVMDRSNILRHVSIHCDPNLFFEHFSSPSLSKTLRTLLFHNTQQFKTDFLNSILASCRALRTLQLSHLNLNSFPDLFGELIHLRYLDLSYNWNVEALPNSICKLHCLQTLQLEGCVSLKELPSKFRQLVSLRHLLLDKCNSLASLPSGLSALSSLVTLDRLIVHHRAGGLRYLDSLNNLRGALTVEIPAEGWPDCVTDARDANMSSKRGLNWMSICWIKSKADNAHIIAQDEAREVLNALEPHNSLEYLNIDGYVGDALPSWVFSLPNAKQLFLTNCTSEYLVDMVGSDTCLRLETLEMNSLPNLKGWWRDNCQMSEVPCLPSVSKVVIRNCPWLGESIPSFVGIESLHLLRVNVKLVEAFLTQNTCFSASSSSSTSECRSASKLKELQLCRVERLSCLPIGQIKDLTALKILTISGCNQLNWVSRCGLAHLTALETLSISDCGTVNLEDEGSETVEDDLGMPWKALERLRDLTVPWQRHLREGLRHLTALERLEINYWDITQVQADNEEIERIGIWWKDLTSLCKLKVGFGDVMKSCFPRWIQYLPFLEDVEFCNCKDLSLCWTTLMIKMRLRKLNFTMVEKVTIVDEVVANPLNRLGSLVELYVNMTNEEEWIHNIPWKLCSSLQTLSLHDVPNLVSLPSGIQYLTSLQQLTFGDCSTKLKNRCTRNGADWPLISGIPEVDIRGAMATTVEKPLAQTSDHPLPLPSSKPLW